MISSSCGSRVTTALRLCAGLGLGLLLAGCTSDKDDKAADALPDVAGPDTAEPAKPDAEAFRDLPPVKQDAAPVGHDAANVTADAEADIGPSPPLRMDGAITFDTGSVDTAATPDTPPAIDRSPAVDTLPAIDVATSPDARPSCGMPSYSNNCSEVSLFECGFSARCENGVISISWHQHACNGDSWVSYYDCTYTCPKGCKSASVGWTSPGTKLVEETCNP